MKTPRQLAILEFAFFGLLSFTVALAQEAAAEGPRSEPGRYFSGPLDLWKAGLSYAAAPQSSSEAPPLPSRVALRESVWAQPIRSPDGTWMIYVPPKSVLDFLETPSKETARAYLRWKAVQAEKLKRAMALLAQVNEPDPARPVQEAKAPFASTPPSSLSHEKLTYFKRPSCPHCATQDAVLAEWLKARPGVSLEVVLPDERPELWKAYAVRGTPTLVLQSGSRPPDVLVGLQSASALDALFARRTRGKEEPAPLPQKEIAR